MYCAKQGGLSSYVATCEKFEMTNGELDMVVVEKSLTSVAASRGLLATTVKA
jgi:hypothetical protein